MQFGKCSPACIRAGSLYDLTVVRLSQFAFPCCLGSLIYFLCVLDPETGRHFFSAICSLPWHIAISKGCQDHCIFSQFDFQNCLSSSEPQSIWIRASRGLPVLSSLCIPIPPLLCGGNTFMAPTFSILSESVMNSEMISIPKNIPTGNFAGHKKCFSFVLCLCCSMVSLRVTSF